MVVSKHEAAQALQDINGAQQRTATMLRYRAAAPYFMVWGSIWLLANCISYFNPALTRAAWQILDIVGIALSIWLSMRSINQRSHSATSKAWAKKRELQFAGTWLLILGFFAASFTVLPPMQGKQANAYISLFWAFLYALMGIWTGWRILAVGVLAAASILVGYFMISQHYYLWIGLVTGTLLILGGVWLRKV